MFEAGIHVIARFLKRCSCVFHIATSGFNPVFPVFGLFYPVIFLYFPVFSPVNPVNLGKIALGGMYRVRVLAILMSENVLGLGFWQCLCQEL